MATIDHHVKMALRMLRAADNDDPKFSKGYVQTAISHLAAICPDDDDHEHIDDGPCEACSLRDFREAQRRAEESAREWPEEANHE